MRTPKILSCTSANVFDLFCFPKNFEIVIENVESLRYRKRKATEVAIEDRHCSRRNVGIVKDCYVRKVDDVCLTS